MDFDTAFNITVGIEAGYSDDSKDPGNWANGVLKGTKYGISAKSYPALDIKNLTLSQAKEVYRRDFWNEVRCDDIPNLIRLIHFDTSVNHGTRTAVKILQKWSGAIVDGDFGPKTLAAVNNRNVCELFIDYAAERELRYVADANFDRFGRGWFRRVITIALETGENVPG